MKIFTFVFTLLILGQQVALGDENCLYMNETKYFADGTSNNGHYQGSAFIAIHVNNATKKRVYHKMGMMGSKPIELGATKYCDTYFLGKKGNSKLGNKGQKCRIEGFCQAQSGQLCVGAYVTFLDEKIQAKWKEYSTDENGKVDEKFACLDVDLIHQRQKEFGGSL